MAPPTFNPSKRMTAQPSRPVARYRPGKAVAAEQSSDEDEESEEEQQQKQQRKAPPRARPSQPPPRKQQDEKDDNDEEGFITDPEDEEDGGVEIPSDEATTSIAQPTATSSLPKTSPAQNEESEEHESEEESGSESDEEASSSEEEPQRKFQRPKFVKRSDRRPSATTILTDNDTTPAPALSGTPDLSGSSARRLAQTDTLIADKIQRDALARAAGRKAWDDEEEPDDIPDDTDRIDPEAEHQAWRLRELQRLKRDREAMIAREKEIEEIERRRNLTAEEREKEDREFIGKQKEEKEAGHGQSGFLARYHHKGAFFQDDEAAEILKRRDVMGAKFVDEVTDKSALPEYMRIRDMTKLGKKGRTRYKDLRHEDTGRWGEEVKRWRGAGDNRGRLGDDTDMRSVDERFLPDNDRGGPTASGANASAVGERKPRYRSRSRDRSKSPPRRGEGGVDTYRPRRRSYSRSRSRSRSLSRSPPRRKRSTSPPRRRSRDADKRRRLVDAA